MADQTIYIQVDSGKLDNAFSLLFSNGIPVGYVPLSNAQFNLFLHIGQTPIQSNTEIDQKISPLIGVSDFGTNVNPGDTIEWSISTYVDPIISPAPTNIQSLSIDSISIFDAANAPSIFKLPIMPKEGSSNTIWSVKVRKDYQNYGDNFPHRLGYRILFSFVYDSNYYYFQFDPTINPKPKSGINN
jgi:hypothetical protein